MQSFSPKRFLKNDLHSLDCTFYMLYIEQRSVIRLPWQRSHSVTQMTLAKRLHPWEWTALRDLIPAENNCQEAAGAKHDASFMEDRQSVGDASSQEAAACWGFFITCSFSGALVIMLDCAAHKHSTLDARYQKHSEQPKHFAHRDLGAVKQLWMRPQFDLRMVVVGVPHTRVKGKSPLVITSGPLP